MTEEHWYYIRAKGGSRQGYMPAKNIEEAAHALGLEVKQCSKILEVIKTEEGFKWPKDYYQKRLLLSD